MCTVLYTTLSGVMCNLRMYIRCTFNALRLEGLESESAHVWYVQHYHPHYIRMYLPVLVPTGWPSGSCALAQRQI